MTRSIIRLATGLAGLAATIALTAGIPLALIEYVGWPLPTGWPDLGQLQRIDQVGITDTTIIKVLAVIVWVTWAQLALALTVETVALARRRAAGTLPLLPGLQPLAAQLVATIALLATVAATPRPALALPLDTAAPAVAAQPVDAPTGTEPATPVATPEQPPATRTVVAGPRDSWWSLAEQHTGDGLRWREIRDLNTGRTVADTTTIAADTDQLQPGWTLLVPAGHTDTQDPPAPTGDRQATHTVEQGDHLWGIAEEQVADTVDRPPDDSDVAVYWRDLIDANRDRLLPPHSPDLIYPGQELLLPPTAAPTEQGEPDAPASTSQASAEPDPAEPAAARPPVGWQRTLERQDSDRSEAPAVVDASTDDDDGPRTAIGIPLGLGAGTAAAALAATGIVATLRWRRRRALSQRMPGLQLPTLLDDTERQLANLDAAAVPDPILDDLASLLASIPPGADPVLVSLHDDGTVVLLFDDTTQLPDPPTPWEPHQSDGGPVGWHAAVGDRGPERSVGLPLLVTLGGTGTTTVLANLAAMRELRLDGSQDHVRQRLRAMSLEAATSRIAAPLEVVIAGDHRLACLEQVRHIDDPQAEIDAALTEIDQGVIADDRTHRLVICHPDTPPPQHLDARATNIGIIATAADEPPGTSTWRLHVDQVTGRLELPDSGAVELALPDLDPDLIDEELTRLDHGATVTVPSGGQAAAHDLEGAPATDLPDAQAANTGAARSPVEQPLCEVQILGHLQVIRNGQVVEGLTPKALEVLAYLATHRDGTTSELLEDAVWAGRASTRGTQRIRSALTKLRSALGDGPDGQRLIPRRTDGSHRIRLSDHVGCDLDRALGHLARAADLPAHLATVEHVAALDLIRGEPFRDMPASWTTDIAQRAIVQLQDAARELAITARRAGDHELALRAIEQGLKLLDPCDALYLEWAELERARDRTDRIPQIWEQLRRRHARDADEIAGLVSQPAPQIELAFQELLARA